MRKLFFAIYFISLCFSSAEVFAAISELNNAAEKPASPKQMAVPTPVGLPDPNNHDEVIEFFKKRFQIAPVSQFNDMDEMNKSNSMDIQHSREYLEQMKEESKSTFEKIYDRAMGRIMGATDLDERKSSETIFYEQVSQENIPQNAQTEVPNVPVVNVVLPNGEKILAPAQEHIPYMMTSYNILPSGLIQVEEDVTIVANGQKLKNGLLKILPKRTTSRAKVRKKLDIQLLSVSVDGKELDYKLEEIGNDIYIKPKQTYDLAPGVYNYKFKYLLDRKLWYYDDFTEFYSDVTGSYLNLVITSANAIVSIPNGEGFISQNALLGYPKRFNTRQTLIAKLDPNTIGFAALRPLLPGEGLHILVSLDNKVFVEPDFNRRFAWLITDYGDILYAVLGLICILLSYILSWRYIRSGKYKIASAGRQTVTLLRYFLYGVFDKRTFVATLLELQRKNVIDISKENQTLMLIKKTDNLSFLAKYEKNMLAQLFVGKDSVISALKANTLKFNRAVSVVEKGGRNLLRMLSVKLNIGYILFSTGMLVISEFFISLLAINPIQTALVLISGTLTIAFYTWMFRQRYRSKIITYVVQGVAALFILAAILFMSIYVHLITAVLVAVMVFLIFEYSAQFAKRNGLLKNKIKEAQDLYHYLKINSFQIEKTHEMIIQQANIFALELENSYPAPTQMSQSYKLDLAKELLDFLN